MHIKGKEIKTDGFYVWYKSQTCNCRYIAENKAYEHEGIRNAICFLLIKKEQDNKRCKYIYVKMNDLV